MPLNYSRYNYGFGNIPVHVHREKLRKDTSEDIWGGKPTEIFEEIATVIEVEMAGAIRGKDLLPIEREKLRWPKPRSSRA